MKGEYIQTSYVNFETEEIMYVVSPRERRYKKRTEFSNEEGINILRIKTGNITKINLIEKGYRPY